MGQTVGFSFMKSLQYVHVYQIKSEILSTIAYLDLFCVIVSEQEEKLVSQQKIFLLLGGFFLKKQKV